MAGLAYHFFNDRFYFLLVSSCCAQSTALVGGPHESPLQCRNELLTVAFRQAWFGPISKAPFFMVMPLVGFDPSITVVAAICSRLWGVVGHTQWIGKLGWLDSIFNTPSTHRVHHGTNLEYIDRNYGNLFIFWDRLFGTYTKEQAPVIFGLVKNLNTNNPFIITFHTWAAMARDIQQAQSFYEIVGYIFGPPGWLPRRKMTAINKL